MTSRASNTTTEKYLLQYEVDTKALDDAMREQEQMQSAFERMSDRAKKQSQSIDDNAKSYDKLSRELSTAAKKMDDLRAKVNRQQGELRSASADVQDYGDAWRDASERVESFGDVDTSIAALSGAASGIGLGGVGEAGMIGSDVFASIEAINRLPTALAGVGQAMQNMGGVVGALANTGASAAAGLGPAAAGMASVAAVALPAAAAVGAVAIALQDARRRGEGARQAITSFISTQEEYYDTLSTGTQQEVAEAIAAKERELEQVRAMRDEIQGNLDAGYDQLREQAGILSGLVGGTVAATDALGITNIDDMRGRLDELNQEVSDAEFLLGRLQGAYDEDAAAINDQVAAIQRQTDMRLQADELLANSTSEAVQSMIEDNERQIETLLDARNQYAELQDESELATEALSETNRQLDELYETNQTLSPLIAQLAEQESMAAKATIDYTSALEAKEKALEEAAEAEQAEQDRLQAMADAFQSYNDDVEQTNEQALQKRADLEQRYADKQVSIAQKAADASEKALAKLDEKLASLQTDLQRDTAAASRQAAMDDLQMRIDAQRDEAKAARDHARDLLQIRQDAQDSEADLILNSDFRGLFQQRRNASRAIDEANEQYIQEQQERQIAFAQESEDNARQREFERQERLIAYQQQVADAQNAYQRESAQIQANKNQQLAQLAQAHQAELTMLAQATNSRLQMLAASARQEIQLAAMTAQQKMQIEQQQMQQLAAMAQQFLGSMSRSALAPRPSYAGGGSSTYNSNKTVNMTTNVRSGSPAATAKAVEKQVVGVMNRVFGFGG